MFLQIDFAELVEIESSVITLVIRGTLLYLGILFIMRVLPRRTGGEMAVMDLIFVLLIAEAAAHSLGDYKSLTEGFIVILTVVTWNYFINVLSFHFPTIERLVSHPPVQVIKDGILLRRNMRREFLTEEELTGHLRGQGVDDVLLVKKAFIESDGTISVIKLKQA